MKFSLPIIASTLAIATPALGCVHAWGDVYVGVFGAVTVDAQLVDNGQELCNSAWGWRWDQDGHISLTCIAGGYVYAFTQDGKNAWYGRPGGAFSWTQSVSATSDYCNPPQGEWCFTNTWNTYMYC